MRCLVTGAAGFIGSHLVERLLTDGHEVRGIDAFALSYSRALKEKNLAVARSYDTFTLIEGDLLELDLPPLLDGVAWVFHLAAQAGVRTSWGTDFSSYVRNNVLATQRLLETLVHCRDIRCCVFASSSSVYGSAGLNSLPLSEGMLPQPFSPYGVSKLAAEQLCALYGRNFGLPVVSLRYFTVYGPRQRPDMAFQRFCQAALIREPLRVFGSGTRCRDFTFVDDIVEANLLAATTERAIGEVLNIGSGTQTALCEVCALLAEMSNTPLPVQYEPAPHGDVNETLADITRARTLLGYIPQVPLRVGLARQWSAHLTGKIHAGAGATV